MSEPVDAPSGGGTDLSVSDFWWILDAAMQRGRTLLSAGERIVVHRMRALRGEPAQVYTRLTGRRADLFREDTLRVSGVGSLPEAIEHLVEVGLVDRRARRRDALTLWTVPELRARCRARGLGTRGRRDDLLERLAATASVDVPPLVRVRHPKLVRRMERWALLSRHPERSRFVVERIGHVRWPRYELTRGRMLFAHRAHLLRWESLYEARDVLRPGDLLEALGEEAVVAPGELDLRDSLRRRVVEAARGLERAEMFDDAHALYQGLWALGEEAGEVLVRSARTLELGGRSADALRLLGARRKRVRGAGRLAVSRMGRRLARRLRAPWSPDPPLRTPRRRAIRFRVAPADGARPRWWIGEEALTVETAVQRHLEASGRRSVFGEGALWTTLFALLFAEAYFLPVPGQLPVPFLSGPLDLGTSVFALRRRDAIAAVWEAVSEGRAPELIRRSDERWRGTVLAGAVWTVADRSMLEWIASSVGPRGLACILGALLEGGWSRAAGLPDLVVLPGEEVRLEGASPGRFGEELVMVEVKGPTDSLRDVQACWHDRLLAAGVEVELWDVCSSPPRVDGGHRREDG